MGDGMDNIEDRRRQAAIDQHPSVVSNVFDETDNQVTHISSLESEPRLPTEEELVGAIIAAPALGVSSEELRQIAEGFRLLSRQFMACFIQVEESARLAAAQCVKLAEVLEEHQGKKED